MNEKTKKTLKKAGMIAGGVIAGAGLMYIGYLCGTGYIDFPSGMTFGLDKSTKVGYAIDIGFKRPLIPRGKFAAIALTKDQAQDVATVINTLIKEVN